MKKLFPIIALTLTLCLFFSIGGAKQANAQPSGTITVVGMGEVTIVPDKATVCFAVVSNAQTLEQANSENTQKVKTIIGTLKDKKIAETDIQTKNFFAHEQYSIENNKEVSAGYRVSNQIIFKTKNLDNINEIITAIMAEGANEFSGVYFESSQMDQSYQTALQNALQDAKQKAQTLSGNANLNTIEIIEENIYTRRSQPLMITEDSTSLMGGELVVRAQVKVMFGQSNTDEIVEVTPTRSQIDKTQNITKENKVEINETNNKQTISQIPNKVTTKQIPEKKQSPTPIIDDKITNQTPKQTTSEKVADQNTNQVVTNKQTTTSPDQPQTKAQADNKIAQEKPLEEAKIDVKEPTKQINNLSRLPESQTQPKSLPRKPRTKTPVFPTPTNM